MDGYYLPEFSCLEFAFRSSIHLELIFANYAREGFKFILSNVGILLSNHRLPKRLFIPPLNDLGTPGENQFWTPVYFIDL